MVNWPLSIPADRLVDGEMSLRRYESADATGLFAAIGDERVWEHIPRLIPRDAGELDATMGPGLGAAQRLAFTVFRDSAIVGTTSIFFEPATPDGVEIGATLFAPSVWGTGINARVKSMLVRELFEMGAQWISLRTDERNSRSAAAIRKLGALDLGVRQDTVVRRDGSLRRSRFFRLEPSSA
ncbi:GNAT family N-acetyltransferase [Nocardia sp. IBHARD005]|uniref:GNAT family N-acetyltransferase n=1 Tax=Nocardia sp. IBHARD005 TaxID=3457765 RepID=UPI004057F97E